MRKVKDKFSFAENPFKSFVNCRPIVRSPLHYMVERLIEGFGAVNQSVDVARLIS